MAGFYKPFLLGINAVCLILRIFLSTKTTSDNGSWKQWLGLLCTLGLQYYSYIGILDDATNPKSNTTSKKNGKALVGGASLDLLALALVVQFGTILWSPKVYWLLAIVPPWGAWSLYKTFKGVKPPSAPPANAIPSLSEQEDEKVKARRQKRAERRRQKRS